MKDAQSFYSLKQYLIGIIAQAIDIFVNRRLDPDKYRDFFYNSEFFRETALLELHKVVILTHL